MQGNDGLELRPTKEWARSGVARGGGCIGSLCINASECPHHQQVVSCLLLEPLPCDAVFATSMKRARQMGSFTGFVHGTTSINDPAAKGTLRLFEQVIG